MPQVGTPACVRSFTPRARNKQALPESDVSARRCWGKDPGVTSTRNRYEAICGQCAAMGLSATVTRIFERVVL